MMTQISSTVFWGNEYHGEFQIGMALNRANLAPPSADSFCILS